MNWEVSVGEPFIDVNGNGVYDLGIDIFIITADPPRVDTWYVACLEYEDSVCTEVDFVGSEDAWDFMIVDSFRSHDVNYNGRYGSPDGIWTPGIPFDDLNGDGEFQWEPEWPNSPGQGGYVPGLPFADINHSGIYDSALPFNNYSMAQYVAGGVSSDNVVFEIDYVPCLWDGTGVALYTHLSDSNVTCLQDSCCGPSRRGIGGVAKFRLDTAGLWYSGAQHYGFLELLLFSNGRIPGESNREMEIKEGVTQFRSIELGQNLDIYGKTYTNLVHVTISRLIADVTYDIDADFFFSPDMGLLAMNVGRLFTDTAHTWYYFDLRYDTLPLPMIR